MDGNRSTLGKFLQDGLQVFFGLYLLFFKLGLA
jgi:hypothetical protein